MPQEDKDKLIGTLLENSENIMQKFTILVSNTCESFRDKNVENIALILKNSHIELPQGQNVVQAFLYASNYWSFFNYTILETLVTCLGNRADKERLADYISDFKEYCKCRLYEVPIDTLKSDRKVATTLSLKTDKHFDVPTQDIHSLTRKLSKLMGTDLLLLDLRDGCIELDLDYLEESNLLPLLSNDYDNMFMQLGITKLYTDEQVIYEWQDDKNGVVEELYHEVRTHANHAIRFPIFPFSFESHMMLFVKKNSPPFIIPCKESITTSDLLTSATSVISKIFTRMPTWLQ